MIIMLTCGSLVSWADPKRFCFCSAPTRRMPICVQPISPGSNLYSANLGEIRLDGMNPKGSQLEQSRSQWYVLRVLRSAAAQFSGAITDATTRLPEDLKLMELDAQRPRKSRSEERANGKF